MGCSSSSSASAGHQDDGYETHTEEDEEAVDEGDSVGDLKSFTNKKDNPNGKKRKPGGELRRLAVMVERDYDYIEDEADPESGNAIVEQIEYHEKSETEKTFLRYEYIYIYI